MRLAQPFSHLSRDRLLVKAEACETPGKMAGQLASVITCANAWQKGLIHHRMFKIVDGDKLNKVY